MKYILSKVIVPTVNYVWPHLRSFNFFRSYNKRRDNH